MRLLKSSIKNMWVEDTSGVLKVMNTKPFDFPAHTKLINTLCDMVQALEPKTELDTPDGLRSLRDAAKGLVSKLDKVKVMAKAARMTDNALLRSIHNPLAEMPTTDSATESDDGDRPNPYLFD